MGPTTVPSATILESIYLRHPLVKSVAQRELQVYIIHYFLGSYIFEVNDH